MNIRPKGKLFYADAAKGYTIKVLIDVLSQALNRISMTLTKEGIHIRKMNQNQVILFDTHLEREKFRKFQCKEPKKISLNLNHLQQMIRNVKKKDSMIIYIDKKEPQKLIFAIKPEGGTSRKTSRTETVSIIFQNEDTPTKEVGLPEQHKDEEGNIHDVYGYPVVIESSDFQKIKKLISIGREINVKMQSHNYISFYCESGQVYSVNLEYGNVVDSDDESDDEEESDDEKTIKGWYEAKFYTSIFNLLIKLPGLCSQIQFYSPKIQGYPLKLKMSAGTGQSILGDIQVYIKDIAQINAEQSYSQNQADDNLL